MKKLMVAALAVAFAAVAQAASVQWGGAFATPDGEATLAAGTQFALVWSETAMSAATTLDQFSVGGTADNGGTIVDMYSINGEQSDNWEFSATWANSGKDANGYYAILALSDDGKSATYMDIGSISGTTPTSPTTMMLTNPGWEGEAYLTSNGYTVTVGEAVPEPTSGLLLLIGMAGLALRRRRA